MKSMKQSLDTMNLGAFSMSLAVKNLEASRRFYEKLGFKIFAGDASQNWLILKNGDHALGLFQGMFERTATHRNLMSSLMFAISNGN